MGEVDMGVRRLRFSAKVAAFGAAVVAAAALAVFSLAGCSSAGQSDGASAGGQSLTVAWTSNQGDHSLDPANNYMGWQGSYLGVYEQLFRIDGDFNVQPMLAESAETADGGLTWVLKVRDGVTFQNGKALDAEAVKDSLQHSIDGSARAKSSLGIASMRAEGQTLTVTLSAPNLYFKNELSEPVASVIDVDSGADQSTPVGTGPFKISSMDSSGNVELDGYEGYWQGTPKLSHVTALYLTDDTSKVNALQSGEVQALMNVGDDQLSLFQNDPRYSVHQTNQARANMLYFNMNSPIMQDAKVREAVSKLVDRDSYINSIYSGAAEAAPAAFPEESGWATGVKQAGYDVDGARELLREAGYADTDGDGYLDKDGRRLQVTFATYQANASLPKICEVMSAQLAQVGIDAKVEVAEKIADRLNSGNWDIGTLAVNTLPTGNPLTYLSSVMGQSGNQNYGKYANPEIDALLAELKTTSDSARQHEIVTQIQNLALADHAYVYVAHALVNDVCASDVKSLAMQGQYDWLNWQTSVAK